jgi:hypothetical protein
LAETALGQPVSMPPDLAASCYARCRVVHDLARAKIRSTTFAGGSLSELGENSRPTPQHSKPLDRLLGGPLRMGHSHQRARRHEVGDQETKQERTKMRSFKAFSLALVAMFALSAVMASAAFATYDSEVATTTLNGSQKTENEFTTDVGTVKCKTATFSGTQSGTEVGKTGVFTAPTVTVHPTYETCNLAGQSVSITTTGCDYVFATAVSQKAAVTVKCETGKEIIIKDKAGLGCEVKVKGQSPSGTVAFKTEGAGKTREVLVTSSVTGISYSWTAGCPNAAKKAGSNTNGTYSGSVLEKGTNAAKEQVGISVT